MGTENWWEYFEVKYGTEEEPVRISGFTERELERLTLPQKLKHRGVDLSAYTICRVFSLKSIGRYRNQFPEAILLWEFPTHRDGVLVGIDFPERFDQSLVRFYRTEDQERHKRVAKIKATVLAEDKRRRIERLQLEEAAKKSPLGRIKRAIEMLQSAFCSKRKQ